MVQAQIQNSSQLKLLEYDEPLASGIIRRSNLISSARPVPHLGLSIGMSMSVLSKPIQSGPVLWAWGGRA
eukprot:scaffold117365_cov18-Tisochrysis_lutea.AAC.1